MFVTFSRYYLDQFLKGCEFSGRVLDVGGKKHNKRGEFRPPISKVECWHYVNTDPKASPDYLCSAEKIPVPDGSYDCVLSTEVIEHLVAPELVLKECFRVLKPKGKFFMSMPFLFPVHADPDDYQRWTPEKIRLELTKAGFEVDALEPRGGVIAVIFDLINVHSDHKVLTLWGKIFRNLLVRLAPLFVPWDKRVGKKNAITTGFVVKARKAPVELK